MNSETISSGDHIAQTPLLLDAIDVNGNPLTKDFFSRVDTVRQATILKLCYVLTSSTNDTIRYRYINKLLKEDAINFDTIIVVMAQQDWSNANYCVDIGVLGKERPSNVHVVIVPNGPKTAGYTRSWCFFLASHHIDDAIVVIRDDRRFIRPAKRSGVGKIVPNSNPAITLRDRFDNIASKLKDGVFYYPTPPQGTAKGNEFRVDDWPRLNQVYVGLVSTFKTFQKLTGGYPQGPILEDYLAAKLAYDAKLHCSSLGRFICKGTDGKCESLARPKDVSKLPYMKGSVEYILAMKMVKGLGCTYSDGKLTINIGDTTQSFDEKKPNEGGQMAILTCDEYQNNIQNEFDKAHASATTIDSLRACISVHDTGQNSESSVNVHAHDPDSRARVSNRKSYRDRVIVRDRSPNLYHVRVRNRSRSPNLYHIRVRNRSRSPNLYRDRDLNRSRSPNLYRDRDLNRRRSRSPNLYRDRNRSRSPNLYRDRFRNRSRSPNLYRDHDRFRNRSRSPNLYRDRDRDRDRVRYRVRNRIRSPNQYRDRFRDQRYYPYRYNYHSQRYFSHRHNSRGSF